MPLYQTEKWHATGAVRLLPFSHSSEGSNHTDCAMFVIGWLVVGQIVGVQRFGPYGPECVTNENKTLAASNKLSGD